MAENEIVEETPKSKEEMRDELHPYEDNKGWCAVCDRSENWQAHDSEAIKVAELAKELEHEKVADLKKLAEKEEVSLPSHAHKPELVQALAAAGVAPKAKRTRVKKSKNE